MNVRSLMNKQKLVVDDVISVLLLITIGFLIMFSQLLAIMSIAVYSLFCLILYGSYRVHKSIFNRKLSLILKVLNLLFGISSIILSSYILGIMFTQPTIPASFILYFIGAPTFLIGLAGLLKGLIVNVFSPLFRLLNILIGATTVFFAAIAIIIGDTSFIFHIITLLTTLILNGILRSALYLSEYGLSLNSFKNLKLVWFLMDSPSLPQQEENQIKS
ncbi:MAG: hypothetical protein KGD61_04105 [Candidatus Lokiarchaeota archaeon]|nr:hypothetical protein [Candidatus Lokiarchaeota archaeon]